jgi:hexokinase
MPADLSPLRLTEKQLAGLRDEMRDAILEGLREPRRMIRALPGFLRPPPNDLTGDTVALDVGGTNMRAAAIEFAHGEARLSSPIIERGLMGHAARQEIGRDEFLSTEAAMIETVAPDTDLSLGYCFSYPADISPRREARLLEWTKGISVRDMVGQSVGALLAAELAKHGKQIRDIPVLNDTVASLVAAAALDPSFDRHIGVIVGSGTNMAGFFPVSAIPKLTADERENWRSDDLMAINLESGAFMPRGILTEWDDALDAALRPQERGKARFEKAISGVYLAPLLWHVAGAEPCRDAGFDIEDPATDAGTVARVRGDSRLGEAATAIVDRSADLVAAGLAGLIGAYGATGGGKRIGVLVEGSLYHKTPGYPERMASRLRALAPDVAVTFLYPGPHQVPANLLGAACAALSQ